MAKLGATPGCIASRLSGSCTKIADTMWHKSGMFAGVTVLTFRRVGGGCVG